MSKLLLRTVTLFLSNNKTLFLGGKKDSLAVRKRSRPSGFRIADRMDKRPVTVTGSGGRPRVPRFKLAVRGGQRPAPAGSGHPATATRATPRRREPGRAERRSEPPAGKGGAAARRRSGGRRRVAGSQARLAAAPLGRSLAHCHIGVEQDLRSGRQAANAPQRAGRQRKVAHTNFSW